jgi:hypothetical protein
MILQSDIQEKLSAIAKGMLSPWDFHVWLEDSSWNMHHGSSVGAIELAGDIKIIFGEYYEGRISEQQLIDSLVSLPNSVVFNDQAAISRVNITPIWWTSGSQFHPLQAMAVPQSL